MGTAARHEPSRSSSHGANNSLLRGSCGKGIFLASSAELGSPRKISVRRVGNATDEAVCARAAGSGPPHPPRLQRIGPLAGAVYLTLHPVPDHRHEIAPCCPEADLSIGPSEDRGHPSTDSNWCGRSRRAAFPGPDVAEV